MFTSKHLNKFAELTPNICIYLWIVIPIFTLFLKTTLRSTLIFFYKKQNKIRMVCPQTNICIILVRI
jgi:hypothetical protein